MKVSFQIFAILWLTASVYSQTENPRSGFSIYMDNDLFYPPTNDDRNYTMGLGLQVSAPWIRDSLLSMPLRFTNRLTGIEGVLQDRSNVHSVIFGGVGYTPDDLRDPAPIHEDRPYASLLYLSSSILSLAPDNRSAVTSELTLGVLGLNAGEEMQIFIHQNISDSPIPRGWRHQISDGGEPTLLYRLRYESLLLDRQLTAAGRQWDIIQASLGVDGGIGYITYFGFGPTIRLGYIRSPFWGFEANPLGPNTKRQTLPKNADESYTATRRISELFLFASTKCTVVGYNALLQGQFRNSDVTFSNSDIEPILYEYSAGIGITFRSLNLTYAITGRSDEFKAQGGRDHIWAGVYLTFSRNL